jgi:aspartyl-tRNA(Asn)/glutamyl-tRNA(Gln) amidotransferase subunit B
MVETGRDAVSIVEEKGLKQVSDTGAIEAAVDAAIAGGAKQVEQYRGGNEKILGWFVGQVMKTTQGKANPQMVNEILRRKLDG